MKLPNSLKPYLEEANLLISEGKIGDIEFSRGTYQVQVDDIWVFLQLGAKGELKDAFCACENEWGCEHLAAGYLTIFGKYNRPVHERFSRSFWYSLFYHLSSECGYDAERLTFDEGVYFCNNLHLSIKGLSEFGSQKLEEWIEERQDETEETSLKFSNLSSEELARWHEGRPSQNLKFELSFWSDIAKWMTLEQERGTDYQIGFALDDDGIPEKIHITFQDFEITTHLSKEILIELIPTLSTVRSPYQVIRTQEESITSVEFLPELGELHIHRDPNFKTENLDKGVKIGEWVFISGKGFVLGSADPLLDNDRLIGMQIDRALSEHSEVLGKYLQVHPDPVEAAFSLTFDSEWNLHILCYLHHPGDLTSNLSFSFGDWVWCQEDGFFQLEGRRFSELEQVIPKDRVTEFVSQNQVWLNTQPGFQTHLARLQDRLSYHLDYQNNLCFSSQIDVEDDLEYQDFGSWVFIPEQGFYVKKAPVEGYPVYHGLIISQASIADYIRQYSEELQIVRGFFSRTCPVEAAGLRVELKEDGSISISPDYFLSKNFVGGRLKYFDEFVYIPDQGFYELDIDMRLPKGFGQMLQVDPDQVILFCTHELPKLKNFIHEIDSRLLFPKHLELHADYMKKFENEDRYQIKMHYFSEHGVVDVIKVWEAISKGEDYLHSSAGLLNLKDDRFTWIRQLGKSRKSLKLSTLSWLRLNAFDPIIAPTKKGKRAEQTRQLIKELNTFTVEIEPDLTGFKSVLRPYQLIGLHWLWFLYHHHLSGILCDDMGLGKTHQAMALLAAIRNYQKKPTKFLIICPTSVIYHWKEKLGTFFPDLRYCTYHGPTRKLDEEYDVLLTTYGIWRNDIRILGKTPFDAAIFDEVQIAKNHQSLVYETLGSVNARIRLGMTGTPIENQLRELKSLFDVVLPTFMPSDKQFHDLFVRPIEKEGDRERQALLTRYIKPFVLRRRKEEVLHDLPLKTEEVSHCALSPEQSRLYRDVLNQSRDQIIQEVTDSSKPVPYIHVFALLSKLKQICNHPALYYKKPQDFQLWRSGKWELFQELLQEARDSGQKVVIFSQFLGMLDIFEKYMKDNEISFASIRGSTIDRESQLIKFNQDPDCKVFLGSLRAVGLGVDLTAGSVVIHYDRWWNAAREDQATDRVHRIGQTRGVQVFKLVTLGTLEEKIDQMITRKGQLMEGVVTIDDHEMMKRFDRKEILEILQFVDIDRS